MEQPKVQLTFEQAKELCDLIFAAFLDTNMMDRSGIDLAKRVILECVVNEET
jgi:hypothetical protein